MDIMLLPDMGHKAATRDRAAAAVNGSAYVCVVDSAANKKVCVGVVRWSDKDQRRYVCKVHPITGETIGNWIPLARRYKKHIDMGYLSHVMGIDQYKDRLIYVRVDVERENTGNSSKKIAQTREKGIQRKKAAQLGYNARRVTV